jgi:isoquinoline 1-oxidoreductase subunit beta
LSTEDLISRRAVVLGGVSAGCALLLPIRNVRGAPSAGPAKTDATSLPVGDFLSVGHDGRVRVVLARPEIGQGLRSVVASIVARELGVPAAAITVEQAHADARFGDQWAYGSQSVRGLFTPMREAAATARLLLVSEAARAWSVSAAECDLRDGIVVGPGNRRAPLATFVGGAATLPAPGRDKLALRARSELSGAAASNIDSAAIVAGSMTFGIDATLPEALVAVVARCPYFGGRLRSADDRAALATRDALAVVRLDPLPTPICMAGGVAVIARSTAAALAMRQRLKLDWERPQGEAESSARLQRRLARAARVPQFVVNAGGYVQPLTSKVKNRALRAEYHTQLMVQAPLEPPNCLASATESSCELWISTQDPAFVQRTVASALGMPPTSVTVHVLRAGGAFGRRTYADYAAEAALVSRQARAPVRLLWTREDDFGYSFYHPPTHHRLGATVDTRGRLQRLTHDFASPSTAYYYEGMDLAKPFASEILGADVIPYALESHVLRYSHVPSPVPTGAWRAVAAHFNIFALESFVDELAATVGHDPLQYRLELLANAPPIKRGGREYDVKRLARVMQRAAQAARWSEAAANSRSLGIACCAYVSADAFTAAVVEVKRDDSGAYRATDVWVAIDCGLCLSPSGTRAQVEGSVVWALSAVYGSSIEIADGRTLTQNFDTYPVLRMNQMPNVYTEIVDEDSGAPGGAGEPVVPVIAPAFANAVARAGGRRPRSIPFEFSKA